MVDFALKKNAGDMKLKFIATILSCSLAACSATGVPAPSIPSTPTVPAAYRVVSRGNTISIVSSATNFSVLSMTSSATGVTLAGEGGVHEFINMSQISSGMVNLGDGRYVKISGDNASEYSSTGDLLSSVAMTTSGTQITVDGRTTLVATPPLPTLSKFESDISVCQVLGASYVLFIAAEVAAGATLDLPAALLAAAGAEEVVAQMQENHCG